LLDCADHNNLDSRYQRLSVIDVLSANWSIFCEKISVRFGSCQPEDFWHEEVEVQRTADCVYIEACRGWDDGRGGLPEGRDIDPDLLSMAQQIWWIDAIGDEASDPKGGEANQLEEENIRLKRLVANLSLDKEMLQDIMKRSRRRRSEAPPTL
jgi:hypothetical protein